MFTLKDFKRIHQVSTGSIKIANQDCASSNRTLKASLNKNFLTLSQQQQQQPPEERGRLYDLLFAGKNMSASYGQDNEKGMHRLFSYCTYCTSTYVHCTESV